MHNVWEWVKRRFRKPETQYQHTIRSADTAERAASVIFMGALVASWWTQYTALYVLAGMVLAIIVPFAIDMLAYAAAKLLQIPGAPWWLRLVSVTVLLLAMSGSILFNTMMSIPWSREWWIHASPVVLYLASEALAGVARFWAAKMREAENRRTASHRSRTANDVLRARVAELESEISAARAAPATPVKRPKVKVPSTIAELERAGYPEAPTSGGPRGEYRSRTPGVPLSKRQIRRREASGEDMTAAKAARAAYDAQQKVS